jgi:hypothetical protein
MGLEDNLIQLIGFDTVGRGNISGLTDKSLVGHRERGGEHPDRSLKSVTMRVKSLQTLLQAVNSCRDVHLGN